MTHHRLIHVDCVCPQITIGQTLMKNKGLKALDLTNTRMGSEACIMIGEWLLLGLRCWMPCNAPTAVAL